MTEEQLPNRDWRRVQVTELKTGDTIKGKGVIIGKPMEKGTRLGFRIGKSLEWYEKDAYVRGFVDVPS